MSHTMMTRSKTRMAELEHENNARLMGVWSVLVEDDNVGSDTFVFKTEAEAVKWRDEVKEANVNVYHVIFIPFRTFEESMDKFAESYAREESNDEDETCCLTECACEMCKCCETKRSHYKEVCGDCGKCNGIDKGSNDLKNVRDLGDDRASRSSSVISTVLLLFLCAIWLGLGLGRVGVTG